MRFSLKLTYILLGFLIPILITFILVLVGSHNYFRWQESRRNLFIRLLGTDMTQTLDVSKVLDFGDEEISDNLLRKRIKFPSSLNEEIPCYLFFHKDNPKKRPGIIVASGRGSGIIETAGIVPSYQESVALELANEGFVTLTCENRGEGYLSYYYQPSPDIELSKVPKIYKKPGWGDEKRAEENPDDWVVDGVNYKLLPTDTLVENLGIKSYPGLLLEDQRRALDYLVSLDYVDENRIGSTGVSLGGEVAFYLAAIDERVKSTVVMAWLTNWSNLWTHVQDWRIPAVEEHFHTMADIGALIPPRYSMFHNGRDEGRVIIGSGFPADAGQTIHTFIEMYYAKALVPSRTKFYTVDIEHYYVLDIAKEYFKDTLLENNNYVLKWFSEDLPIFAKRALKIWAPRPSQIEDDDY
jgi:dienelactone hydrolase